MIVVGAGPAGSIAAWRLAKAGHQVLALEKGRFPRDKVCGDILLPDALRVMRVLPGDEAAYRGWVRFFSGLLPIVVANIYFVMRKPVYLVLLGAFMQATMLPMLAAAALYFR